MGRRTWLSADGDLSGMWIPLLVLAFLAALNPVRLGVALLLTTRRRPLQNLLAYWTGLLFVSVPALAVPLVVLHTTSISGVLTDGRSAADTTVGRIEIVVGVLILVVATALTVRGLVDRYIRAPRRGRHAAVRSRDADTAIARLLEDPGAGRTPRPGLLHRARRAWRTGSPWVALVLGVVTGMTIDGVLYVLAVIVPSGAALATQLIAAAVFVVGMFAPIEVMIVGYWAAPAATTALAARLHGWTAAHRRPVLVAVLFVLGISLTVNGLGNL